MKRPDDAPPVVQDHQAQRLAEALTENEADARQPISAVVIDVAGMVESAPPEANVLATEGWTSVQVDDRLVGGTQIRTGLRAHVTLRFGETTVMSLRSATHASLDQCYRSAVAEVVRVGLGYGTVRGASSEGEVRSDVVVDSPVATLAKRGTEGWQVRVEPVTGRFHISLAQSGLVEAIQKLSAGRTRSRLVRPGEYATQSNIMKTWVNQAVFDRNVQFYQADSLSAADVDFTRDNTRGFTTLAPGGGSALVDMSQRVDATFVLDQLSSRTPAGTTTPTMALIQPLPVQRPEGNFGTAPVFRVRLPMREPLSGKGAFRSTSFRTGRVSR